MAYNKVTHYGDSENILESEIGLVTKTGLAKQSAASTIDGRKVIKAGSLFDDSTDEYTAVENPTADSYEAVTPVGTENPTTEGWYEKSGSTYSATTDTSVDGTKTYYEKSYTASNLYGVVLHDYDMTDYDEKPIAVVVAGRLKSDKVASAVVSAKATLAAQGLYLV